METWKVPAMSHDPPIGVIFDMDGVLIDSADAHFQSWCLLARENNTRVTHDHFTQTFGRQNQDVIPILFGDVNDRRLRELADRKEALYRDLIRKDPPLVKGAASLIRSLNEQGARVAIGSSGPLENIRLVISALQVDDRIATIVSSDDVTRGKPDPQVFIMAAERLGVPPGRCVVIEDAPVGIQAARAAGMRSVGVLLYHTAEALGESDLNVTELADLSAETVLQLVRERE